jgi:hypothetical protein
MYTYAMKNNAEFNDRGFETKILVREEWKQRVHVLPIPT